MVKRPRRRTRRMPDRDAVGKCAYRHDYLRSWDSREDWFKCTFLRAMGQGSFFMFTCRKCFAKTQFVTDGATGPECSYFPVSNRCIVKFDRIAWSLDASA